MLGLLTTIIIFNILVQTIGLIIGRGLFMPIIIGTVIELIWFKIIADDLKESK